MPSSPQGARSATPPARASTRPRLPPRGNSPGSGDRARDVPLVVVGLHAAVDQLHARPAEVLGQPLGRDQARQLAGTDGSTHVGRPFLAVFVGVGRPFQAVSVGLDNGLDRYNTVGLERPTYGSIALEEERPPRANPRGLGRRQRLVAERDGLQAPLLKPSSPSVSR